MPPDAVLLATTRNAAELMGLGRELGTIEPGKRADLVVSGDPFDFRDLSDRIRQQEKAAGAIVASSDDGRAYLVVNLDESLVQRGLDATAFVRELGKHIGGGGGGKPTLAEAGGKNPAGVRDALRAAKETLAALR